MTVLKRGDRYGVKVWDRGQKRYRWVGSFDSEAAALQAEQDAKRDGQVTVEQWARIWLSDYARPAAATRKVYMEAVRCITRELGGLALAEVDRPTARKFALAWPRNTSAVARTMWNDAKRDGVCAENPWSDMRLKQSRGRKDIVALTEQQVEEMAALAERIHGDYGLEARAIVLTFGYVSIRPGELCALKWGDIAGEDHEVHVQRNLDVTGQEKLPKNDKTKLIVMPPIVLAAINRIPRSLTDDYVFHSLTGRRMTKGNLWTVWKPIRVAWEALGNEHLDLYELRHAAATILLERGVSPGDVAEQLGHSDGGKLVMERYGHPNQARARDRLKMAYADMKPPVEEVPRVRRSGAA